MTKRAPLGQESQSLRQSYVSLCGALLSLGVIAGVTVAVGTSAEENVRQLAIIPALAGVFVLVFAGSFVLEILRLRKPMTAPGRAMFGIMAHTTAMSGVIPLVWLPDLLYVMFAIIALEGAQSMRYLVMMARFVGSLQNQTRP